MTYEEAKKEIKRRLGNDYWFLPVEAEEKWIEEMIEKAKQK